MHNYFSVKFCRPRSQYMTGEEAIRVLMNDIPSGSEDENLSDDDDDVNAISIENEENGTDTDTSNESDDSDADQQRPKQQK